MFSAVLVALVLAVYWQVTDHQFLVCDDDTYVTQNPRVLQGLTWDGVRWAFQEPHAGNYHPLTWISHTADVELFGLDAGAHHLVSVVLHAATAVLLLVTLRTMTGFFWMATMLAYAWYARRGDLLHHFRPTGQPVPQAAQRMKLAASGSRYFVVMVLYLCALLSKSMAVTFPCILVLCDYWPLSRQRSVYKPQLGQRAQLPATIAHSLARLLEKLPLLLIAAWTCWMAVHGQSVAGAVNSLETVPMKGRIANALVTYVAYLAKTIMPVGLSIFYPHPVVLKNDVPPRWIVHATVAGMILLCVTVAALATCRR